MQKKIILKLNDKQKEIVKNTLNTVSIFPAKMQFTLANNYYAIRTERKLKIKTVLFHRHLINKLESMI